jgi:hypothetical protein
VVLLAVSKRGKKCLDLEGGPTTPSRKLVWGVEYWPLAPANIFVFLAFLTTAPTTPPAAQGLLRYGVYESQDDAQSREDVDHREELADRRGRCEISQSHGGKRGDAEVDLQRLGQSETIGHGTCPSPYSCRYSPKRLEVVFSEVRMQDGA